MHRSWRLICIPALIFSGCLGACSRTPETRAPSPNAIRAMAGRCLVWRRRAAGIDRQFRDAWQYADVTLTASHL